MRSRTQRDNKKAVCLLEETRRPAKDTMESIMWTILSLIYRRTCKACLIEMRRYRFASFG